MINWHALRGKPSVLCLGVVFFTASGCGGNSAPTPGEPPKYVPIYNAPDNHPLKDVTLENESENMDKIKKVTGIK